ncbi:MAG: protein-L-isoaspartate(D-aspartate) O-methyltransferase [Pseudomonadota bacterium]
MKNPPDREELPQIIAAARAKGVSDDAVLQAMRATPRTQFIAADFREHAGRNQPLPIDCGQTISQPSLVGVMTQTLAISDRHKVLEIGTGSGYQTVILSKLARRVYTIERHKDLLEQAKARFLHFHCQNILSRLGDGHKGWPEQDHFDRIIVTAAAKTMPTALLNQLGKCGLMIAPIGDVGGTQILNLYRRDTHGEILCTEMFPVRFVPLVEE